MKRYIIESKIGEGSFSQVYKAKTCNSNGVNYVAVKCLKSVHQSKNGKLPSEIYALKKLRHHPNILKIIDIFVESSTDRLCIVTELMCMNLYEYMLRFKNTPPLENLIRPLIFQLLSAIVHLHSNGFFHRDIKPENLLIQNGLLKLSDFGTVKSIYDKPPFTEYIATRWYRAPECLNTIGEYNKSIDLWSVGCVMFELFSCKPLFPAENESEQLPYPGGIIRALNNRLTNISQLGLTLMAGLLSLDPENRLTADEAFNHEYFNSLRYSYNAIIDQPLLRKYSTDSIVISENENTIDNEEVKYRYIDLMSPIKPDSFDRRHDFPFIQTYTNQEKNIENLPCLSENDIVTLITGKHIISSNKNNRQNLKKNCLSHSKLNSTSPKTPHKFINPLIKKFDNLTKKSSSDIVQSNSASDINKHKKYCGLNFLFPKSKNIFLTN